MKQISDIKSKACAMYNETVNLEESISKVLTYLNVSYKKIGIMENSPVLLQGRFNSIRKDKEKGIIAEREYSIEINRIKNALETYIGYIGKRPIKKVTEVPNPVEVEAKRKVETKPSSSMTSTTTVLLTIIFLQFLVILALLMR